MPRCQSGTMHFGHHVVGCRRQHEIVGRQHNMAGSSTTLATLTIRNNVLVLQKTASLLSAPSSPCMISLAVWPAEPAAAAAPKAPESRSMYAARVEKFQRLLGERVVSLE